MADATDLNSLVSGLLQNGQLSSVTAGGSAGVDPAKIGKILSAATATFEAQAIVRKSAMAADKGLTDLATQNLMDSSAAVSSAADAASRVTEQKVGAQLDVQTQNQQLKKAADLDINNPDSVLSLSIKEINDARNATLTHLTEADRLRNITLSKDGFSAWFSSQFNHTPYDELQRAKITAAIAENETTRIKELTDVYTGAEQVNKGAANTLSIASAHDQAQLDSLNYTLKADELKDKAIQAGSGYLQKVLSNANTTVNESVAQAQLKLHAESMLANNARLGLKVDNLETSAPYIQKALKFFGVPGAENWDAKMIKSASNNPQTKAMLTDLLSIGSALYGAASIDPSMPTPPVVSDPGTAYHLLHKIGGKLPDNMTPVQRLLDEQSQGTDSMNGKMLKPQEQVNFINQKVLNWTETHKNDLDSTDIYGKPPLKVLVTSASMNTPALTKFTDTVIKPLAMSADNVPASMILTAAESSGLSDPEIIAGIVAYANTAKSVIDATRRPQVVGLRSANDLGYTATLPLGSVFGGHRSVDLSNPTAVGDYIFNRRMYQYGDREAATPIGALFNRVMVSPKVTK